MNDFSVLCSTLLFKAVLLALKLIYSAILVGFFIGLIDTRDLMVFDRIDWVHHYTCSPSIDI